MSSGKSNKPKKQHIVPVTYLKQFHIGDKKHVYCIDSSDPHRQFVQTIGLRDSRFIIKNFYTDERLENRFAIEEFFANEVESLYPKIISAVNNEEQLSKGLRSNIILWIYCSHMRKVTNRLNYEDLISWMHKTIAAYKKEEVDHEGLAEYSKRLAKDVQLNALVDQEKTRELMLLCEQTLALKQWRIIKTTPSNPFWANDSPVFSPNMDPRFQKISPYHKSIELNGNSFIYFVLSPLYCIEISPFYVGTPLDATLWNMDIPYTAANLWEVEFINEGVFMTRHNLVISNSKESLESRIKFKKVEKKS